MKHSSERLENRLTEYAESGAYPFHMPGHKRNPEWETAGWNCDITEIDGFDDLHDPNGLLKREMERAATFYGTKETLFSVNGSTGALLAAISAAVPAGGRILAARNCHRSVFNAIYLRGLNAEYVMPEADGAAWACAGGPVSAEDIETALQKEEAAAEKERNSRKNDRTAAVVITSPTYDGIVSDIRAIADTVHRHGAVLIVDEAHGAHLAMHPCFPESAVQCGADLVVQSMHKTLPAMTQTALLHNVTGRVPSSALRYFMDIFETSSPSYVLMASITACLHALADNGAVFEAYSGRLKTLRERLGSLKRLRLFSYEAANMYDFSKLCIGVGTSGLTGPELYDLLRKKYGLQMEMKTPSYVLAMTSCADTEEGFRRLAEALEEIDAQIPDRKGTGGEKNRGGKASFELLYSSATPKIRMTIAEAADKAIYGNGPAEEKTLIPGEVCTVFAECYPPGIPLLVPGEVVPADFPERVRALREMGLTVRRAGREEADHGERKSTEGFGEV
ncbi:MAG: aminotransferase class I/II-fold pyridoxal phosphate-dependent enzyme [Lachnospiraceae bacterium]|nr:aminotransferase class I/II-fold pyridoxal phosphate-dependent enzyme [Lachnospiraceae bacterium]